MRVALVCSALAMTLLTAPAAEAAAEPKAAECYRDIATGGLPPFYDPDSGVACTLPHRGQVLSVGKLPASVVKKANGDLSRLRGMFIVPGSHFGHQVCDARSAAPGIWPKAGKAVAAALGKNSAGFMPATRDTADGSARAWMLPDEEQWAAGVRTVACMQFFPSLTWAGDLRQLETSSPLLDFRDCRDSEIRYTSCAGPHTAESLFAWAVTDFPKGDASKLSDSQWAAYDRRCQMAADALIGAKRKDLQARAETYSRESAGNGRNRTDVTWLLCTVRRSTDKDLPAGTVVGLGSRPLGS